MNKIRKPSRWVNPWRGWVRATGIVAITFVIWVANFCIEIRVLPPIGVAVLIAILMIAATYGLWITFRKPRMTATPSSPETVIVPTKT